MSSTTTRSARRMRAMALVTESSARWRRTRAPSCSRVNQATFLPGSTAAWPRASSRNVLPVPDGPQTTRFSCRVIHSRVRSACWVGAGTEDRRSSQALERLAGGEGGPGAAGGQRGPVPAGDFLGQQGPEDLGGIPPLGLGGGDDLGRDGAACAAAASGAAAGPGRRRAAAGPGRRRSLGAPGWRGEVEVVDREADVA